MLRWRLEERAMSTTPPSPRDTEALRKIVPPDSPAFEIRKIGHVVLRTADLERSVRFYTKVLGFRVSDVLRRQE
jgi:catechol-2,3-dioxygenase